MQPATFTFPLPNDLLAQADFFEAFSKALRSIAGGARKAVEAVTGSTAPQTATAPAAPVVERTADPEPVADAGEAKPARKPGRPPKNKEAAAAPAADPNKLPADYLLDGADGIRATGAKIMQKVKDGAVILEILAPYGAGQYPAVPPARRQELLAALKAKAAELGV
jgi:hypothetical protein